MEANNEEKFYERLTYEKIKNLYENTIQKGETFSPEMEEEIRKEILRIIREREEWEKFKEWCQK